MPSLAMVDLPRPGERRRVHAFQALDNERHSEALSRGIVVERRLPELPADFLGNAESNDGRFIVFRVSILFILGHEV